MCIMNPPYKTNNTMCIMNPSLQNKWEQRWPEQCSGHHNTEQKRNRCYRILYISLIKSHKHKGINPNKNIGVYYTFL